MKHVDVHDYDSAVAYLAGGRNKQSRPIANNTRVVTTGSGVGIKFHSTVVVEYRPDNTIALNTGGWRTVTTRQRINKHVRINIQGWCIHHPSDERTPAKIQKCRTCHGKGHHVRPCSGQERRYDWSEGYGRSRVTVEPCWHKRNDTTGFEAHVDTPACYRCGGTGQADYGSKPIPTPMFDGIVIGADGRVIPCVKATPYDTSGWSPGPHQYHAPHYKPPAPNGPSISGHVVLNTLRALLPGITTEVTCPACPGPYTAPIENRVQHLNDTHHWTREAVADWLETLDVDLAFPVPA